MRSRLLLSLLAASFCTAHACAQSGILLNEVLPGNQGLAVDSTGRTPDWIEVYNPTTRSIDLMGWRIAMAGRQHVFTTPLTIAPKSFRTLLCDGRAEEGPDHIAFKLAKEGGALLLIAPDGITIADVFSFPSVPADVSIGRMPDGAKNWSFYPTPTPGKANRSTHGPIQARCPAPTASVESGFHASPLSVALTGEAGCRTKVTTDGTAPTLTNGTTYDRALELTTSTTLNARAFAPDKLPSKVVTHTYLIGEEQATTFTLDLAPDDLWDDSTGIYTTGLFNNNTRNGKAWERPGTLQQFTSGSAHDVGVRLSGSGSRGARKRSFKLFAADAFVFPDSTRMNEALLRADASPHAFLRNTTLEVLVQRFGLALEVQPSLPVALYLNTQPWGLYRWMPAKDSELLKQRSGAEAVDVLEGPSFHALSGSNDHFLRAQELLLHRAPVDSIDRVIDTESLIDLACMDLWTGRADHELNVRCYRPKRTGGRWRWMLFDMDLWAPPNENSVQRMSLAAATETPFVPQLLAHPVLQERLLSRITALQAAVYARVASTADSIHRANEQALLADFRRWELELDRPHPDSSLVEMKRFATARPDHLFAHLARHTGRKLRTVHVEAPAEELGHVLLNGLALAPGEHAVRCFSGVKLKLEARPAPGVEFASWKGVDLDSPSGDVELARARNLRAVFRRVIP